MDQELKTEDGVQPNVLVNPTDGTVPASDKLRIVVDDEFAVTIHIDPLVWIGIAAAAVVMFILYRLFRSRFLDREFELDEAEFGFGDQKITLRPNDLDRQIAYRIWVEVSTRKIGLPIDLEHDVIAEIYDSWYAFFGVTRELIKDIPVSKVRRPSTQRIIKLSIDVLNDGLRPHLTTWQARFRRWYERELATDPNAELHPQDVQKQFPDYEMLTAELMALNERLINYRKRLNDLVHS